MNNLLKTLLIASLALTSYSAFAGNSNNTMDSQEGLTQDDQSMESKVIDANSDGMISKDEYMSYHEKSYGKMKQTNGNVSIKDMQKQMSKGTTKGNKLQPSNTKDAPPVTTR